MARAKREVSTFSILIFFLLSMGFFVTTSLYLDVRHKNTLLLSEVERLQSSQVLLMVPDEQAEVVAKWMAEHPQATAALLQHAKPQQEVKVNVGPGVEISEPTAHKMSQKESRTEAKMSQDDIVVPSRIARTSDNKVTEQSTKREAVSDTTDLSPFSPDKSVITPVAELAFPLDTDEGINNDVDGGKTEKKLVVVPLIISENEDGVKVISLPHGGIRVTTRENN